MSAIMKPVGVTLIGVVSVGFGAIVALIALALGLGNILIFDTPQPVWLLLLSSLLGLVVAYLAIRVGRGLLRDPPAVRESGEVAIWVGIPIVWLVAVGINLLLTEGQDDVSALFPVGLFGMFWTAVLVGAGLYMRSRGVRAYFVETIS